MRLFGQPHDTMAGVRLRGCFARLQIPEAARSVEVNLVARKAISNCFLLSQYKTAGDISEVRSAGQDGKAACLEEGAGCRRLAGTELDEGPATGGQNARQLPGQNAIGIQAVGPARKCQPGVEAGDLGLEPGDLAGG